MTRDETDKESALAAFLLARIAEDEADAAAEDRMAEQTSLLPSIDSDHQARWSTDRVRAECEAKRQIVEHHSMFPREPAWCEIDEQDYPCRTLRALILPYANHPDFRDEWRLEADQ